MTQKSKDLLLEGVIALAASALGLLTLALIVG